MCAPLSLLNFTKYIAWGCYLLIVSNITYMYLTLGLIVFDFPINVCCRLSRVSPRGVYVIV